MTPAALQAAVLECIYVVAPDAEDVELPPDASIRKELDLDSMDFLDLVTLLHGRLGVEIPEADYPRLRTLDAAVGYLEERLAG